MSDEKYPSEPFCPLVDKKIDNCDCVENSDMVDGIISKKHLPKIYQQKENWEEICKNCRYHGI